MRPVAIILLTCVFALAADSPFVGTWAMNKAKSKLDPNGPQYDSLWVRFMQDGATLKAVVTANGTAGPPALINGTLQPMSANAGPGLLGATHYISTPTGTSIETLFKKNEKVIATRKTSLSGNRKVLTAVTEGTSPTGEKLRWTVVFDKR